MRVWIYLLLFPCILFSQQNDYEKAVALFNTSNYEEAIPFFKSSLENGGNKVKCWEYLGTSFCHQNDWDNAIYYYEKLVSNYPQNAEYHYKYAGCMGVKAMNLSKLKALRYIGDIKTHFTQAAELDSKHIDARWALVELYLKLPGILGGSERKARQYAEELEDISTVDGLIAKGYIAEMQERPEEAAMYFDQARKKGNSGMVKKKLTELHTSNKESQKIQKSLTES